MANTKNQLPFLLSICAICSVLSWTSSSCNWEKGDEEDWVKGLITGSIVGAVFALIAVVVAALPLCCGVMKDKGKILAVVAIVLGIIVIFVPLIASLASGSKAVNDFCAKCEKQANHGACTEEDKQKAKDGVSALGAIIAYTAGYGFVAVILGIVAAGLGCCIFCKCCKMKDEEATGGPKPAVVGQVVG